MIPAVFGMVGTNFTMLECDTSNELRPAGDLRTSATDGIRLRGWALVLGASSGFGAATALALARAGLDVFGVHLDRKATMGNVERLAAAVNALGREARFFNVNAADPEARARTVAEMERVMADRGQAGGLSTLLHSLAFGTLRPFVAERGAAGDAAVVASQMEMTLDVMAHSLVYWAQALVTRGLMGPGGRIFAMTSSGAARALPSYGAVSAAKAALEAHVRQLAVELAPRGITVNAIRAGVTATPAAQKIPGYERLAAEALRRNPSGRMTTPEDVARAVVVLAHPDTAWITGNVIGVDGGEDVVG
jgi:NAD(P)-dependent dehydrogenase (short-subunit alcohol dehydrogenase family)